MIGIGVGLGFCQGTVGGNTVSPRRIFFIDGEFFRGLCNEYSRLVGFDFFKGLNWGSVSSGAARTFYYDSLPAKRANQTDEQFQQEYQTKIRELDFIRSQRWFHVKDGVSRYRKRDKRREQKGVDILLAIDAVQMAVQGLADEITIFTSDTDFFPVFEIMNQTKCRGLLKYQYGRASDELTLSADYAEPISLVDLATWCGVSPGQSNSIFPELAEINNLSEFPFLVDPQSNNLGTSFLRRADKGEDFQFFCYMSHNRKWHVASSTNWHLIYGLAIARSHGTFDCKNEHETKQKLGVS